MLSSLSPSRQVGQDFLGHTRILKAIILIRINTFDTGLLEAIELW